MHTDVLMSEEAVDEMTKRIRDLENQANKLQMLVEKQYDRLQRKEKDHRRLNWIATNPIKLRYHNGAWYIKDDTLQYKSLRTAIDAGMKPSSLVSRTPLVPR